MSEKKHKGADLEHMRAMTARRMELAKTDPSKKGGRPRKNFSKAEAEEHAIKHLWPRALRVLEEQLESEDERVRQKAALEVIAYVKGKPTQTVKNEGSQVHTIVYETAAWYPSVIEGTRPDQLPPAA